MITRWRLGLAISTCLVVAGYWLLPQLYPTCAVTRENFQKIERGMTRQQIEALLGGQEGDYSGGRCESNGFYFGPAGGLHEWVGTDVAIRVCFEDNGNVSEMYLMDVRPANRDFWGCIQRWLPRSARLGA
jgi:hypothetical protein